MWTSIHPRCGSAAWPTTRLCGRNVSGSLSGSRTAHVSSGSATNTSNSVAMTTLTPKRTWIQPASAPHRPPPTAPSSRPSGISTAPGNPLTYPITAIEHSAPIIICPSAPMFQTSARKAKARPTPINTSGVALISVSRHPVLSSRASLKTMR